MKSSKATKAAIAIGAAILAVFLGGCNNFFHELIPPDGDRILSFEVPGQIGAAEIAGNTVRVKVSPGADLHALLPRIAVSPGASLVPVTFDYVAAAFPEIDLIGEVLALHTARDLPEHVKNLIRSTPGFNVPALDMPIDFSGPVNFFVISGQGTIREYTAFVEEYTAEPRILGLRFSKFDNPELLADAVPAFAGSELRVTAMHPVEMPGLSFALIPSFEILGELLEIDGAEIASGETAIQFDAAFDVPQARTITVTRGGLAKDYALIVTFREDPDTVRSITDFRFAWADNPGIAATSVAAIVDDGDFGTITLQVLYSGARSAALIPRFVTPGTARVGGALQASGQSAHDFSRTLEYRVTSRNLMFSRTYTVRVEFVSLAQDAPRMLSFNLSQAHNPGLIRSSVGEIGDGHIVIDVHFGGAAAPETLVPEFSAQGIVTALGSVQVSGASPQNFGSRITYAVTCPLDPARRRHYSVQTRLIRDTSSDALITSFGFFPEENPWLSEPLIGRIQQGTITVFGPADAGLLERMLIPRFEATGPVSVSGAAQVSGISGRVFGEPVEYEVVSANGLHGRTYTVVVRELLSLRIFVDQSAVGHGDGTSWQNAFRCLREAAEAAAMFPGGDPREVWIAAGTYRPSDSGDELAYIPLSPNVGFVGGFAGWETARGQRNPAANRTIVTGDLGGGRRSWNLFGSFEGNAARTIGGDVSFEDIEFADAGSALAAGDRRLAAAISARLSDGAKLRIGGACFSGLRAAAVRLSGSSGAEISGARISGIEGLGIDIDSAAGDIEISAADMRDVSGTGIRIAGGSGRRELSGISGQGIGGDGISISAPGNAGIAIRGAEMREIQGGAISVSGGAGQVEIGDVRMGDVSGDGIVVSGSGGARLLSGVSGTGIGGYGITIDGIFTSVTVGDVDLRDVGAIAVSVIGPGDVEIGDAAMNGVEREAILVQGSAEGNIRLFGIRADNFGRYWWSAGIQIRSRGNVEVSDAAMRNFLGFYPALDIAGNAVGIIDARVENARNADSGVMVNAASIEVVNAVIEEARAGMFFFTTAAGERRLLVSNAALRDLRESGISIGSAFDCILISGSTIENTGGRGIDARGSVGARNVNFEIRDSAIRNTAATGNGGGVLFSPSTPAAGYTANFTALRSRFESNSATGSGGAIFAGAGATTVTVADSRFEGSSATGSGGAVNVSGSAAIAISGSRFYNSSAGSSGGAVNAPSSSFAINISGSRFYNSSAGGSGGVVHVSGNRTIVVANSEFINTSAEISGGAVNASGGAAIDISGSRFYNNRAGTSGGAVNVPGGAAAIDISGSRFENSSAMGSGGAISIGGSLAVANSQFINTSSRAGGGAIMNWSNPAFVISGSRFENTRGGHGGAISGGGSGFAITDTYFINSTSSRGDANFIHLFRGTGGTIRGSSFIHDDRLIEFDPSYATSPGSMLRFSPTSASGYSTMTVLIEDSVFTNLRSNVPGESYIFNTWYQLPGGEAGGAGGMRHTSYTLLTLRNSVFNFGPGGGVGLLAFYTGSVRQTSGTVLIANDSLLMDGVTINGGGNGQPLIWLRNGSDATPGTFRFRPNNVFNGVTLDSEFALMGLAGAGVIRLQNGAMPVMVD